jgi:hypothetical protein
MSPAGQCNIIQCRLLATLMLSVGISCATRPVPDPQFADCAGDRVAIVSNNWRVPVDVYTTVPGQGTPMVIGTLLPGERQEIVLPAGAHYVNVRATERARSGMTQPSPIQIRYLCR